MFNCYTDWLSVSYDSVNEHKKYKESSYNKETDCQRILINENTLDI